MSMRAQAPELYRVLDEARASGQVVVGMMQSVQVVIDLMAEAVHAHQAGEAQLSPRALLQLSADLGRLAQVAADANQVILDMLVVTSGRIESALDILHRVYGQHEHVAELVAALNETLESLTADFSAIQRNEQRVFRISAALLGLVAHLGAPDAARDAVGALMRRLTRTVPLN